jgi:ABC-type glycerol-3-phosphate transport system permease component
MNRAVLLLIFLILSAPIWFMFTGSLQDSFGVFVMPPPLFPKNPTLENYGRLFSAPLFARWTLNTVLVLAGTVTLSVVVSCMAGYSFAFYRIPFKKALWMLLLAGIMIPRISLIVPMFVVIKKLHLSGTLAAVILSTALSPFGLFLARTYFETVPRSVLEAARIEGAGELRILFRIVIPISRPIIVALSLFAGIASLQDYMWQMLVLQRPTNHTLLVGLTREVMRRGGGSEMNLNPIGQALAAGVILLLPMVLIFAFANKYFTQAIGGIE